jgi:RNA polymerase sigma-70 factor, ECF subfamily
MRCEHELERVTDFKHIYDEHLPFMWRAARYLGVAPAAIEDVLQDVFLVVHRALPRFEGRSSLRTWIYGILLRVVRNHRRSLSRRQAAGAEPADLLDEITAAPDAGPHEALEAAEAMCLLAAILEELDDARREVFVLVELEQLAVPEIAELLGENVNTIYGRLRAARMQFDAAARRSRARVAVRRAR